jgi:chromosome segregation ATPase
MITPELLAAIAGIIVSAGLLVRAWAKNLSTAADVKLKEQEHAHQLEVMQVQNERDREKRHNETEDRFNTRTDQVIKLFEAQLAAANEKILRLETQQDRNRDDIKALSQKNDEYLSVNNSLLEINDKLTTENKRLLDQAELVPGLRVQIDELKNQLGDLVPKYERLQAEYDDLLKRFNQLVAQLTPGIEVKGDAA